jgi:hypothetical protein
MLTTHTTSPPQFTDAQWMAELLVDLQGTGWIIDSSSLPQVGRQCLACVYSPQSDRSKHLDLARDVYRTSAARKMEILRQLVPWLVPPGRMR